MATSVQAVAELRARTTLSSRLLIRWHLLSLDAPTVAASWTWFMARANGVHVSCASLAAMFSAVWILYAADRLLDARGVSDLQARHRFHQRHTVAFVWGIVVASLSLALLLPQLRAAALLMDAAAGVLLIAWFAVIHTGERTLPKEFVVGIFFAASASIPTLAQRPDLRLSLLPPACLFGALCCLNCFFIDAWEHEYRLDNVRIRLP